MMRPWLVAIAAGLTAAAVAESAGAQSAGWGFSARCTFSVGRDSSALFSARGDDIFLVKVAYWSGR